MYPHSWIRHGCCCLSRFQYDSLTSCSNRAGVNQTDSAMTSGVEAQLLHPFHSLLVNGLQQPCRCTIIDEQSVSSSMNKVSTNMIR